MTAFFYRLFGAAVLDAGTYEGVEADRRSNGQAALVVIASSLAAGVGAGGWHGASPRTFVTFTVIALVTWLAWAMLTFQIGSRWLPGPRTKSSFGEMLRTVGFAAAPGLLQAFGAFPKLALPAFVVAWVWMFAAMVIAVEHALDYANVGRATAVCAIAILVALALAFAAVTVLGRTVQ